MKKEETFKEIKKVSRKIVRRFKPKKIILFGSWAWGTPHKYSDIDLLIIKNTSNTRKMAVKIDCSLFPRTFPMDLIVYTPEQIKTREQIGDLFIKEVLTKGKVIYAKQE